MNGFGERPKFWNSEPAPLETTDKGATWKDFGTSMSAISFGFVATAILISMFLFMAIFEHLLRPRLFLQQSRNDAEGSLETGHPQAQLQYSLGKLGSSQSVGIPYQSEFSVLMPGQQCPTYLAQPAPLLPCPREGITHWPSHVHHSFAPP